MKKISIIILVILSIWGIYFLNLVSSPNNKITKPIYFKIESGESLNAIASNLYKQDIIKSEFAFKVYAKFSKKQASILAGEHLIGKDMNIKQVLDVLTTGGSLNNERKITIIEGWRADEIAEYLEKIGVVTKKEFLDEISTSKWKEEYDFLSSVNMPTIEGFLFPDTYRIFNNATASDIIRKMLNVFDSKLSMSTRNEIAKQGKTIFEVVTLASIIEREVPEDKDKR